MTGPFDPGARPALVFSHPNHELAVFGLLQRTRPRRAARGPRPRRGEWLRARGEVSTVITHAGHDVPLTRALADAG